MVEIEAKLKVDSLEPIAQKLAQIGAKFVGTVIQTDYYFDDSNSSMAKSDKALRLRHELQDGKEKNVLAYKGPREGGKFKRRQEIQFGVDDAEQVAALLGTIGFKKAIEIHKRRKLWRIDDCEIALDELPVLGSFVEIEGPSEEKITELQKKLGLGDLPHIKESYTVLIELNRKKRKEQA